MTILERFVRSKTGRLEDCEDILFMGEHFAAVIDGATARTGARFGGVTAGRRAALLAHSALETLPGNADLPQTLRHLTAAFAGYAREAGLSLEDGERPSAAAAIYSRRRREVWLIGDCRCRIGEIEYDNPNGIDRAVAGARSLVNQAELEKGRTAASIMAHDPGAEFIRPLLMAQFRFQNRAPGSAGGYGYSAIDGREIPPSLVRTVRLRPEDCELSLASDGYPVLADTLAGCERALADLLAADPLCIFVNRGVKGLRPGLESYDDRAYLRLAP